MFKDFLMKKMLKAQGVSEAQIDTIITIFNKDPELFKKIAEEIQGRVKSGEDQSTASMAVMQKYQSELQAIMK